MCGLVGFFKTKGERVHHNEISIMMEKIKHRGPDDDGIYIDKNVGLGFVRLSILDLSLSGHQPMFSQNNNYVIIFNGEVFNYIELRKELSSKYFFKSNTDTEVILAAYQEWGEGCLNKLNGMFAFAIYNIKSQKLFVARDRFGIKPLYFYHDNSIFIFASEIKAILPHINKIKNEKIVFDYLYHTLTEHTTETFFVNVNKLQHGHFLTYENGKKSITKWYDLRHNVLEERYLSANSYKELFYQSIKLRLRSDVPIGVSLSGGIDSSSITSALIEDLGYKNINTFSGIFGKNVEGDESSFIDEYNGKVKNMYTVVPTASTFYNDYKSFIEAHNEPISDVGPYIQFKVMELASKYVKVTLDGQGADEQLAGYHFFYGSYFKELLYNVKLITLIKENYYYIKNLKSLKGLRYLIYYMLPIKVKKSIIHNLYPSLSKNYVKEFTSTHIQGINSFDLLSNPNNLLDSLVQHFEYWLEHLLKWGDLNSMHFSIESRVPFLDYRLVEATLSTPSYQKINNGYNKYILRESLKDILPQKILFRKDKKGFSNPKADWFRTNAFKELIQDIINSPDFKSLGYFDPKIVSKQFEDHVYRKNDNSVEIWKWINIYEWNKMYF